MPGISRRLLSLRARLVREDDGFGLIEVMVSAVLVVAFALATFNLLDGAQRTSSNNRSRDVAAQLAQSEQDKLRQMPLAQLADGYDQTTPIPVGNIPYTVHTTADWVQDSGGAVTCSTSGSIAYLRTTTSVTWPGMGKIDPVTADAIIDPSVAALGAKKGALTVLLQRADGTGTPGITVTAGGQSAVTDENGCAVIGNLDIGPQTAAWTAPGYVDKDSKPNPTKTVNISAGTIAQTTGSFDVSGRINLSVDRDAGATWPPAWNPMKYTEDHDQRTSPTTFTADYDAGDGVTTQDLWPFPSAYRVYAGTCAGNNPANAAYGGSNQGFQLTAGQTQSLAVTMPTATIKVDPSAIAANKRGNRTELLIAPETGIGSMTGCGAGAMQYWSNSTGGSSIYTIQVPYGVWRACVNYRTSDNDWRQYKTGTATGTDTAVPASPIVATPSQASGTYKTDLVTTVAPNQTTGTSSNPSNSC